jgi:hypothetical protein
MLKDTAAVRLKAYKPTGCEWDDADGSPYHQLKRILEGRNLAKLCDWQRQDELRSIEESRRAAQRSDEREHYRSLEQDETRRLERQDRSTRE